MVEKQKPADDEILRMVEKYRLERERAQTMQARERAAARCMLRDDVAHVQIRSDGTLLCTDHDGRQVLRPAGWRGRA